MSIDEKILTEERVSLKKDFDVLSNKIRQFELDLGQMKSNLNAIHGAIQQTDKFIELCKEKKEK
jgi:hypothetical protein